MLDEQSFAYFILFNVQCLVQSKDRSTTGHNGNTVLNSERGFWHRCWDLKEERYGSLDGLNISINGVEIPLFFNSLDISAESILVFLSLLQ